MSFVQRCSVPFSSPRPTSFHALDLLRPLIAASLLVVVCQTGAWGQETAAAETFDWPMWRGPEQNGLSREQNLISEWSLDGKNLLWQSPELATRSTPIILNDRLYTLARSEPDTPREGEKVICADPLTGRILWEAKFNVFLSDVPAERVAWSSVVGDPQTGHIYAMGVCGYMLCLDGQSGRVIWSRSLNEEFGLLSTYGGRTNVPVLFEDLVITSAVIIGWGDYARPTHRFLAFNKLTGEMVWFSGTTPLPEDTTYSTPVLTTLAGQRAMVFGAGDGRLWAMQPRTGVPLWQYRLSRRGVNTSPVVYDSVVYAAQSEENPDDSSMGAIVAVDGTKATGGEDVTRLAELWRHQEVMIGRSSMLVVDGRVYGVDDSGNFYVYDAKTGEQIGRRIKLLGTIMRASLLYADGKIYAPTTSAWHVLEPTADGAKITHRMRLPTEMEVHGSPIVWRGRIILPTTDRMFCLGVADSQPRRDVSPPEPAETPASPDDAVAHVQLVPCELMLAPGESAQFRVRLFNARGQHLRDAETAQFTVEGPAQITPAGQLITKVSADHSAAIVKATVDGLTGQARVRLVPPLPWKFDFSTGEVPTPWIGMRYRHVVREVDGDKVMVKVTTIPKGTRSQGWIGPIDLNNYTVEADLRGALAETKIPDMGLIAQRYTLDLMGASQQVQIRSWTPQLARFSKSVPFAWQPNVWYRMKFRAETDGERAILRGKVWPRDAVEPSEWTIEATDEAGNLQGSPGFFGNANDAEIFIDNVVVYPNDSPAPATPATGN